MSRALAAGKLTSDYYATFNRLASDRGQDPATRANAAKVAAYLEAHPEFFAPGEAPGVDPKAWRGGGLCWPWQEPDEPLDMEHVA
jgi:hypothetical protein